MDHRHMNPGLYGFRQFLVVFAEPSAAPEPCQRAFCHPPAGKHLELVAVRPPAHRLHQPAASGPSPRYQSPGSGCVSPDYLEAGEAPRQFGQYQPGPVPPEVAEGTGCWLCEWPRPGAAR